MMYGSYRLDEGGSDTTPRLALDFPDGKLRFYSTSVRIADGELEGRPYDEEIDITADRWNAERVICLVRDLPGDLACDVLMDQEVFAGVGNMIKNEALFRARVHPLSKVGRIPDPVLAELVGETRRFSIELYEVERKGGDYSSIFQIYRKRTCGLCGGRISLKKTGARGRISFFCASCQILYA